MKEEDIRKRDVFNRYLELVREDVEKLFDFSAFIKNPCPACGQTAATFIFEKYSFRYVQCNACQTLYANPRPTDDQLGAFYRDSISTSYWVNEFFKPVAEVRREKIFRPRARHFAELVAARTQGKTVTVGDVGAGFGFFLQELREAMPANRYIAIEPSLEMAKICRDRGLEVVCALLEDVDGHDGAFDYLASFELMEHLHEPSVFIRGIHRMLRPGGWFYLSTLNGGGFDIQLLWEHSKSIFPPHHINFFNTRSITVLLESHGFEVIEVATPGKLDVDIVEGMVKNEGAKLDRFWHTAFSLLSPSAKDELQNWLARNLLSSHMTVLARKR